MITPKKGRTILLIAAWAIAVHNTNRPGTVPTPPGPLVVCSAWTTEPTIRRGWHRHPSDPRARLVRTSRLFSTAPPTAESTSTYRDLFPASDTVTNGTLQTGANSAHTLYYEIHGTGPLTALFLHGGPGAGCFPNHARFFDPTKYTVVLLDQRGAGKSTPRGCVEDNTLDYLVEDCERLRYHLYNNYSSDTARPWDVVLGGSWGATLGLAYAQKHPSALRSLVLRGICALRPSEVDWLFGSRGGSALRLPEAWKNFSAAIAGSDEDSNDGRETLHAYYDCLFNTRSNGTANNALRLAAARSWMMWEMAVTASAAHNTNNSNTNQSDASNGTVLVSSPERDGGNWRFENYRGAQIVGGTHQTPTAVVSQLRKEIEANSDKELTPPWGPRPVTPIVENSSMPLLDSIREASNASTDSNKTASRFRLPPDYVPAQAMLTCYYSVNDRFAMGDSKLLEGCSSYVDDNRNRSDLDKQPIKIIGIQGGKDPICPPDTALDLLRSLQASTNNMELRIPLESGHSMYDPAIKHELVSATDRLADQFLGQ